MDGINGGDGFGGSSPFGPPPVNNAYISRGLPSLGYDPMSVHCPIRRHGHIINPSEIHALYDVVPLNNGGDGLGGVDPSALGRTPSDGAGTSDPDVFRKIPTNGHAYADPD